MRKKTLVTIVLISLCCVSTIFKTTRYSNKGYFSIYPTGISPLYDWQYSKVELNKAWEISIGRKEVLIGVIDSGISSIPDDLIGQLNTSLSVDCLGLNRDPFVDLVPHGTCVAGVIGANGENSIAKSGVLWKSNLVSLRCDDNVNNLETPSAVIEAIDYATDNDIPILNFSGGFGYGSDVQIPFLQQGALAQKISNYPGLIVCAAGNAGAFISDIVHQVYPQSFTYDNLLVVGSSNNNDEKCSYSNYGPSVDLFAPSDISTINLSDYGTSSFSGTSCSSPLVAGVAGLLKSINPSLTTSELKETILNNCDELDSLSLYCTNGRRLNAYKATLSVIPSYTLGTTQSSLYEIGPNEYQWFKFNGFPGGYRFTNNSNLNITASLYSDIQSSPLVSGTANGSGTLFDYTFLDTNTYYLKISNNSEVSSNYSISSSLIHVHDYTDDYIWYDDTKHYSYCECGNAVLQPHIVHSGEDYCILCDGYARMGFIVRSGNEHHDVLNDSYILPNKILILGDHDYKSFLDNELSINVLLGVQNE